MDIRSLDSMAMTDGTEDTFADVLRRAIDASGYRNVREVARAAGLSHTTIYDMLKGYDSPSLKTLLALSRALPAAAPSLYRAAGVPTFTTNGQ